MRLVQILLRASYCLHVSAIFPGLRFMVVSFKKCVSYRIYSGTNYIWTLIFNILIFSELGRFFQILGDFFIIFQNLASLFQDGVGGWEQL